MFNTLKSMNTEIKSKSYLAFILEKITSLQDLLDDWEIYTNRNIIVSSKLDSKYREIKGGRGREREREKYKYYPILSSKQELVK